MASPFGTRHGDAKRGIDASECDYGQRRSKTLFAPRQSQKIVSEKSFSLTNSGATAFNRLNFLAAANTTTRLAYRMLPERIIACRQLE
ncbi:hypothetical protein CYK37_23670 [Mesorhizobium loti]|nr:hypothetical protein [Mesorhizobium loti]PLP56812.1 hypothetical protein CYK37_23670 [Mesorhizobium loti]